MRPPAPRHDPRRRAAQRKGRLQIHPHQDLEVRSRHLRQWLDAVDAGVVDAGIQPGKLRHETGESLQLRGVCEVNGDVFNPGQGLGRRQGAGRCSITRAPSASNRPAMLRPIPREAPVTRITDPARGWSDVESGVIQWALSGFPGRTDPAECLPACRRNPQGRNTLTV